VSFFPFSSSLSQTSLFEPSKLAEQFRSNEFRRHGFCYVINGPLSSELIDKGT